MLHRKLGNTGIAVSKIALGTMYFGSETPEEDAFAILDTFVEADGNLIDTADAYVGGLSEQIIGRWFAASRSFGQRDHRNPLDAALAPERIHGYGGRDVWALCC